MATRVVTILTQHQKHNYKLSAAHTLQRIIISNNSYITKAITKTLSAYPQSKLIFFNAKAVL